MKQKLALSTAEPLFLKTMTVVQAIGVTVFAGHLLGRAAGWGVFARTGPAVLLVMAAGLIAGLSLARRLSVRCRRDVRAHRVWLLSSIFAAAGIGFSLPHLGLLLRSPSYAVLVLAGITTRAAAWGAAGAVLGGVLFVRLRTGTTIAPPHLAHRRIWRNAFLLDLLLVVCGAGYFWVAGQQSGSWAGVLVPVVLIAVPVPLFFGLLAFLYLIDMVRETRRQAASGPAGGSRTRIGKTPVNPDECTRIFMEVHQGNPQEGPGDRASTGRALALLKDLPRTPTLLDAGCGPGRQTLDLCRLIEGPVLALDMHGPYLERLCEESRIQGLSHRVTPVLGDMGRLPCRTESLDAIWSEGAIYNIGFRAGLEAWRPFLRPGGYVAVTELTWLRETPPDEVKTFWKEGYPAMQGVADNLADLEASGYRPRGHFTLPESAWWDYYGPVERRVRSLQEKYAESEEAELVFDMELREMALYRGFSRFYGYVFYIGQAVERA